MMEDLHRFTKHLLHDLRSPIGAIMLNASWLTTMEKAVDKQTLQKISDAIIEQARYTVNLIDKAERVYILESGRFELTPIRFNLVEYTGQIIAEFNSRPERAVQFHPDADEVIITTDPVRYREALVYLLENVILYSLATDPIEVQISKPEGRELSLTIIDRWVGMPQNERERIFEPFNRIQTSPGSPGKGDGLGMYLAKAIIENILNGSVLLDVSSGTESRYQIQLPVEYPGGPNSC